MSASKHRDREWLRRDAEERRKARIGWYKFIKVVIFAGFAAWGIVTLRDWIDYWDFVSQDPAQCLARNFAWETTLDSHKARNEKDRLEKLAEIEAIGRVVLARTKDGRRAGFEGTICKVVYQRNQFSWTNNFGHEKIPGDKERWAIMQRHAANILQGKFETPWPAKYSCIRWYKRTDGKGVSKRGGDWFKKAKLEPIVAFRHHTFYCKPE